MRNRLPILLMAIIALTGGAAALIAFLLASSPPAYSNACLVGAAMPAGRTYHVDPVHGTDAGDGSSARPWRSLQRVIDAGLVGSQIWEVDRLRYWPARLVGRTAPARIIDNAANVVGGGDTILLAPGDHGAVTLRGIVNRAPITIRGSDGMAARLSSLRIEGASNFTFDTMTVSSPQRSASHRYLVDLRPEPDARRSANIVFRNLQVGGQTGISQFSAQEWAQKSSDGMRLFGDCIDVHAGRVQNVHSGIVLYQVHKASVEQVDVANFSVDGIAFSGNDIVIRDNLVRDHWPTADGLHPDCIQGQATEGAPRYGPVLIERNVCLSDTSDRHSQVLQGITIFNGRWSGVTIRCNFVRPTMQHGISLYGVDSARIERNIVIGWDGANNAWIAAMPSKENRQPTANVIVGNQSAGYLNAVTGAPNSVGAMLENLRINPRDAVIRKTLSREITGVHLQDNVWVNPAWDMSADRRFTTVDAPEYSSVVSTGQARAKLAATADCRS